MKFNLLSIALISASTLLPLIPSVTPPANACSETAVGVQVRVSGERNPQTDQTFNANQTSDPNCFNNNVVGVGQQVSIGSQAAEQNLEFNQHVGGGDINQTGITTPTVQTQVPVQVDVYSPAHDQQFMNQMMQQP
jgi:hypothetical protein